MMAAIALLASTALAHAADPVGRYRVVGNNPGGGSRYTGSATVERTGDTLRVTWTIGGMTYTGTGIGNDKGFAVAYRAANQAGIAIYAANGDGWEGAWTYAGGRRVGAEMWTRRGSPRVLDLQGGGP
jgi:hypothetical protein